MSRGHIATFVSGRMISFFLLITFQIFIARQLTPGDYGNFALAFALATTIQTVASFGIPRVISMYVSQIGSSLGVARGRALIVRLVLVRLMSIAAFIGLAVAAIDALHGLSAADAGLIAAASAFILLSTINIDADGIAQALSQQRLSRDCLIGEAAARLALVGAAAQWGGGLDAVTVLAIGAATSGFAGLLLLTRAMRTLRQTPAVCDLPEPRPRDIRNTAVSGYASSLAWFASSPAIVRVVGGHWLPMLTFAGFAFMQALVVSFQRYTPGIILFPFVEPAVMRNFARTGDHARLETALSLVTKADIVFIGAAIVGASVAGGPLVELMTDRGYGQFSYALPALLLYIVAVSIYRSFEIVSIILGARSVLLSTLAISLTWLALCASLVGRYGLTALLLCPLGDAASRLAMMFLQLRRLGMRRIIDLPIAALAAGTAGLAIVGGRELARLIGLGHAGAILSGTIAALAYLLALAALRPLRTAEAEIVAGAATGHFARLVRRFAR